VAVYAGSFDPVTLGHRSVAEKAAMMFDRVVCLVAIHPSKRPLFEAEERVRLLSEAMSELPNVSADFTAGFTVDYARSVGARVLVRGVRDGSDADYETQLARLNQDLAPEIVTIFVPADRALSRVSSSRLRELAHARQPLESLCHPAVASALRTRCGQLTPV